MSTCRPIPAARRAWRWLLPALALLLMLAGVPALAAITFDPTPSSGSAASTQMEIIQDASKPTQSPTGAYLGIRLSSSVALTNVYARAIVGGTGFMLDATEAADHFIGELNATAKTSYWFINYPASGSGSISFQVYSGNPAAGGTLVGTSTSYTVSSADADQAASPNSIVSVTGVPAALQLGQTFNAVVCYKVNSTVQGGVARLAVQPASVPSFDPYNLRLGNVRVTTYSNFGCTGTPTATLNNQLFFAGPVASDSIQAVYTFQTVGTASASLTPVVSAKSGPYKYNSDFDTLHAGATIPGSTNRISLKKSVNITESAAAATVTYTLTATNTGTADGNLDSFVDTLPSSPASVAYVAGTTRLNGSIVFADPAISGQVLTWSNPDLSGVAVNALKVPAGGTLTLSFQATVPATRGLYTNSAVAYIAVNSIGSGEQIGTTPATASTAVGAPDLAVTKTTGTPSVARSPGSGTSATYTLTVTNNGTGAAGVKVIDTLPAGFTYASTTSVTLADAAVAASAFQAVTSGAQTAGTPQWDTSPSGGFTLPGGKKLVITFVANVASTVAEGTYHNSASASSTTTGATVTNYDGTLGANTAENVQVSIMAGVPVSGVVYSDANHNLQRDGVEAGTGLALFAKLVSAASPGGPAQQAAAVDPATGAYQFATVPGGSYTVLIDDNGTLGDVTPTLPAGWVGTEMPGQSRSSVLVASNELRNLNFGLFQGNTLAGRVFNDNGNGAGVANDGLPNGGEIGLAGISVRLTDSAATVTHDSASTDGGGNYLLWIPAALGGASLKVTAASPSGFVNTGASAGTASAGVYTRATNSTAFTYVAGSNATGVNFGMVPGNTLAPNGWQTAAPGTAVFFAHAFVAGSSGQVTFSLANAATPAGLAWSQALYQDSGCTGAISAASPLVSGPLTVTAGQMLCLVVKQFVPASATPGVQNAITLSASFSYTGASPALSASLAALDVTTVDEPSAMALTKRVSNLTQGSAVALTVNARPGETLQYTLTAINNGKEALRTLVINDATPAFTTFVSAACPGSLPASLGGCSLSLQPAVGAAGNLQWTFSGALQPSGQVAVTYQVRVND